MTTLAAAVRWNETLASLWADERKACVAFLSALREFDDKQAWEPLGFNGLFRYLTGSLGMSAGVAYRRFQAVRLSRWCPDVLPALEDGRLCLTTLGEVSKVLTPENWNGLLPRFFGLSKKQAEAISASMLPAIATPTRDVIVPLPSVPPAEVREIGKEHTGKSAGEVASENGAVPQAQVGLAFEVNAPAFPERNTAQESQPTAMHRIHFTASETFVQKLQKAKDAVAHRVDVARLETVLEQALEALLEKEAKRSKSGIAQATKRQVQERDEGQCQWPLLQGGVCGEKRFLQIDHVVPKARGGDGETDNLRLLCARHNREAAK
ncbi:MAG: HNH endonuclease, partial [Myxococcaceae bacterium]